MQKAITLFFVFVSAIALIIVFYNSRPFDPGVNLPELDAGKPFAKWNGIVVTCLSDGKLLLDRRRLNSANTVKELKEAVKARKANFAELHERMPQVWQRLNVNLVPVLLCMDKNATIDTFNVILGILCRAGCANAHIAVKNDGACSTLTLCIPASNWYFWGEETSRVKGRVQEVRARANKEGKFRLSCRFLPRLTTFLKPPIILEEEEDSVKETVDGKPVKRFIKPPTHETIEPLFDMIEQHKDKNVIVHLDLNRYSKKLTWGWLVKLLARLEKTNIKGYAFAAPD